MRTDSDPSCFFKAVKHVHLRHAISEEFNAFLENNTWNLVPRTSPMHVIGCKWIFKTKFKYDESIERYKARLVALGNHQYAGIDYHKTFNPAPLFI